MSVNKKQDGHLMISPKKALTSRNGVMITNNRHMTRPSLLFSKNINHIVLLTQPGRTSSSTMKETINASFSSSACCWKNGGFVVFAADHRRSFSVLCAYTTCSAEH